MGLLVQHFLRTKKRLDNLEEKAEGFFKTLAQTVSYTVCLPLLTVKRTFGRAYLLLKLAFLEPNNSELRKKAKDMNKIINVLERIPEGILSLYVTYIYHGSIGIVATLGPFLVCIFAMAANASKRNFPHLLISLTLELGYRWLVMTVIMIMNKTVGGSMIGVLSLLYFCNVCLNGTGTEDGVYDWIGSYSSPLLTQIAEKFTEV